MSDLRARPLELVSRALDEQIADYLTQLLPPGRPRRVARMYDPGHGDKYRDIPRSAAFTQQMLLSHASGRETWATTVDAGGMSRIGVIEVDAGGRAAVLAVLAAAAERALSASAIAVDNPLNGHAGGHVWFLYREWAPIAAIVAQLREVANSAGLPIDSEIWPCNQVIRLPFGYHRWAKTRGELLTQHGEIFILDDVNERAAALDLVLSLPQNSAPPAVSQYETDPQTVTTVTPRRITPGEQAAERFDRARFNREHPLEQLLAAWGAVATPGGFSCPCGVPHSHATTLYISRLGKLFSYSSRCKVYTTKGYDAFGFYVKTQHNDDINAALRELNPISGRQNSALVRSLPEYVLSPEEHTRRAAEAQRKRQARKQQALETIADVRAGAAEDTTLRNSDRKVLDALLTIAGDRGWCRPSKERIAELSSVPLGTVKRVLFSAEKGGRLEGRYFVSEGDGGGPKATAIRTFLRGSFAPAQTDEMIHESYRTCDLIPDSKACERGADPPQPDRALLACVRELAGRAAEPGWAICDYAELDDAGLEAEADRLLAVVASGLADGTAGEIPQLRNPTPAWDSQIENSAEPTDSACYIPALDWTSGGRADLSAWRDPLELRVIAGDDGVEPAELLDLAPEPEPMVRSAPTEPAAAREYWSLKHKRAVNYAQERWIRGRLAALEIWIPASQALALEPPPTPAIAVRQPRRRRAAAVPSAEFPQRVAGEQLTLELPIGTSAGGFARALIERSPPLTSS